MKLKPGALVVLEGLDSTGKSTQADLLGKETGGYVVHMPSSFHELTRHLYELMEEHRQIEPMTRQLLHLACHASSITQLIALRDEQGLILDRWWWSTIAYARAAIDPEEVRGEAVLNALSIVAQTVWEPLIPRLEDPSASFIFLHPVKPDPHNTPALLEAYERRVMTSAARVVPLDNSGWVHKFIMHELEDRGLLEA